MWIVRLALRRPYTFVVMSVLIAILGGNRGLRHADGHFPEHRYTGGQPGLELCRNFAGGDGKANRHHQ